MPALAFPKSSTPGVLAGEGEGRLVNCFFSQLGDASQIRRVPGLALNTANGEVGTPRGLIDVPGHSLLYGAFSGVVRKTSFGGTWVTLTGALAGTDFVTLAHNQRTTTGGPDVAAVRSAGGAYLVTTTAVSAWPTINNNTVLYGATNGVPSTAISVAHLDGYLLFFLADSRIFATGLNTTDCDPLSFATANSHPGAGVRLFTAGSKAYACKTDCIEIYFDAGGSPFPLSREATVIPVGLKAAAAVAGFEPGWDREIGFVASDGTVRLLNPGGYEVSDPVSTRPVERFIAASTASTLEALVYVHGGRPIWALSSDQGTWCLDLSTKQWHERQSVGTTASRWRASRSVYSSGRWLTGDTLSGYLLDISDSYRTEAGSALAATLESAPLKQFPKRITAPALFADFTKAAANTVAVSWSKDGGATWVGPLSRSLATADKAPVRVNRLGLPGHNGLRVRLAVTGTDDFSFLGATVEDTTARRP